jgi:hypothetical protein
MLALFGLALLALSVLQFRAAWRVSHETCEAPPGEHCFVVYLSSHHSARFYLVVGLVIAAMGVICTVLALWTRTKQSRTA